MAMLHPIPDPTPAMISRQKLLEAAMRVFAESGFRGATTRRIADAAGVNEVTLFRQFKSKTALINAAAHLHAQLRMEHALPREPVSPLPEVTAWCSAQLTFLRDSRALIRKCMAELEEHPQMAECMRHGPDLAQGQLREYARRLCRQRGADAGNDQVVVACMMLQGALFSDAMGRDMMPHLFPRPLRLAGHQYARAFLQMLGLPADAPSRSNGASPRGPRRAPRS